MDKIEIQRHDIDGGPIYAETDFDQFVVEPFNATSSALFVVMATYWIWRVSRSPELNFFLLYGSIVLLIGGIGGTVYHAFRTSKIWITMDWLPILILTMSAAVYFLSRVLSKKWLMIPFFIFFFAVQWLNFKYFPSSLKTNFSYAVMGFTLLAPIMLYLYRTKFRYGMWIGISFGSFVLAVLSRYLDPYQILPMGTHFLWHLFGLVAAHSVIEYIYLDDRALKKEKGLISSSN